MSHTSIDIHRVVGVTVGEHAKEPTTWVTLEFADENGETLTLAVFSRDTQGLLAALSTQAADKLSESRRRDLEAANSEAA